MNSQIYFENYSPVGDITVLAMCLAIFMLLAGSYLKKNRNSGIFINIVIYLMLAAITDIVHHIAYNRVDGGSYFFVNLLRIIYHGLLFSNLLLYVVYIVALLNLKGPKKTIIMSVSLFLYVSVIFGDLFFTVTGPGFSGDPTIRTYHLVNVFLLGYILFLAIIAYLTVRFGRYLYKRVMFGLYGTIALSFIILVTQARHAQNSYTVVSFLPPTVAILYLLHSNPIDARLGAADPKSLEDTINFYRRIKKSFLFASLHIKDLDQESNKMTDDIRDLIRTSSERMFKSGSLYQVSGGHFVFIAGKDRNSSYLENSRITLRSMREKLNMHAYEYLIVVGESIDEISQKNEYISFIRDIERGMNSGDVHLVRQEDVVRFRENEYIRQQMADIYQKKDFNDPRVLAFCQPVFSLKTGRYDTAETLMRLCLPETGIISPDKFISSAEENGYIHVLTDIILKKTCDEIGRLINEGYEFKRISVNLSILDLREEQLSEEIKKIIKNSSIPADRIAFEITESQSEYDFNMVKKKISELKQHGIKFYLDDFGTGYSNMERILELPFDIIKFDRSLVLASDASERSEKMVGSLAGLFAQLDYAVLYEGIEDQKDEERCRQMSASYLQGYKYSKPIPIKELRNFFARKISGAGQEK